MACAVMASSRSSISRAATSPVFGGWLWLCLGSKLAQRSAFCKSLPLPCSFCSFLQCFQCLVRHLKLVLNGLAKSSRLVAHDGIWFAKPSSATGKALLPRLSHDTLRASQCSNVPSVVHRATFQTAAFTNVGS